jgi:hypothetical protein
MRHSAILRTLGVGFPYLIMEVIKFLLIDTGFEMCHVCFASPHHFHQILRHYSTAETYCALSMTLLACCCHVGHKNGNRLHAHGSACTLVAATQDVA